MKFFAEFPDGSYRAHNATVLGDISIGQQTNFWFNTVARGDVAPIVIGKRVNVQDGAIIHCDFGITNVIEDDVSIGHGAVLHGQFVGRASLIGMRATLLARTRIGSECLVAAGAVVTPDTVVPDRHLVAGIPAKVVRPLKEEELKYIRWLAPHYVELAQRYVAGEWSNTVSLSAIPE